MSELLELLGVDLPVIQAPMAGSQGSALALAVSNAGGLGSLPCALLSASALRTELAALASASAKPINLNFFCHAPPLPSPEREAAFRASLAPYYQELGLSQTDNTAAPARKPFDGEMAELVEEFAPRVVSFHFGLPSDALLQRVKRCGTKVLSSATTLAEARWLEARGVDAVIAQGAEAGGHRGMFLSDDVTTQIGTFALVSQLSRSIAVPVIAAGGIAWEGDVRAARFLGAAAVQVGTAFLFSPEATPSPIHRAALHNEAAAQTAITNLFTGRPARGIVNRLMREHGPLSPLAPAFPRAADAVSPLRARAESQGSGDFSPLWCGQNALGCQTMSAAERTRALAAGFA